MSALSADLPIGMNTEEYSGPTGRAELSFPDQLAILYRVLRVLAVGVRSVSHQSSLSSGSSSGDSSTASSSVACSDGSGLGAVGFYFFCEECRDLTYSGSNSADSADP